MAWGGEECGQTRAAKGQIEQVEEESSLVRFCQSHLSGESFWLIKGGREDSEEIKEALSGGI